MKHNPTILLQDVRKSFENHGMTVDEQYIQLILNQAKDVDVVSFDIFDTLVTRLFECPIDIFAYVENVLLFNGYEECAGFARHRLQAEEMARNFAWQERRAEEICIDEIYAALKILAPNLSEDLIVLAKETEKQAEVLSCIAISDNLALIQKLKAMGKEIIFVSDMYLKPDDINQILKANNLDLYDHLFVSSESGKTKHTGRIWQVVKNKISNKSILHIGDNQIADVEIPKTKSIQSFHYTRFLNERRVGANLDPTLITFSLLSQAQRLRKNISPIENENIIWENLGSSLGSLILYSFTDWLEKQVRTSQIEHIFFCARDAQVIEKCWDLRNLNAKNNTTSSYLYVSRKVLRYSSCYIEIVKNGRLSNESLNFLTHESCEVGDSYRKIFKDFNLSDEDMYAAGFKKHFGNLNNTIDWKNIEQLKSYIQENLLDLMLPAFEKVFKPTAEYYKQEGLLSENKKVAIVDLGWFGTIQLAITNIREYFGIKNKVSGYYYGLFREHVTGRLFKNGGMEAPFWPKFLRQDERTVLENAINLLENLHSANHETTIDFELKDGKYIPVFKEDQGDEYINRFDRSIKRFQEAALHVIGIWSKGESYHGVESAWVGLESAKSAMAQVFCSPNKEEISILGQIPHATLHTHEVFHTLIPAILPKSTSDVDLYLQRGGWPVGVMTYWKNQRLDITHPHLYVRAKNMFLKYEKILVSKF